MLTTDNMFFSFPCPDCTLDVPATADRCPHCARPGFFPNVRAAEAATNQAAFQQRFADARAEAGKRGVEAVFDSFSAKTGSARAVWCKPWGEVQRLAVDDKQGAGTYYQQIEAQMRVPDSDEWDALRRVTDAALFPGYEEQIRFAALSLDHTGPKSYGPITMTFRDDFIAHRASVFDENTVVFMIRRDVKLKDAARTVLGYRAPWDSRGKLAATKLGAKLSTSTPEDAFAGVLLQQGPSSKDENFVEVHIYGPVTIRSIERVDVDLEAVKKREKAKPAKARLAQLRERLHKHRVELKELS